LPFDRPAGSLGARGSESPPCDHCGVKPPRGGMRRTLDLRPSPSRPAGPRGLANGSFFRRALADWNQGVWRAFGNRNFYDDRAFYEVSERSLMPESLEV
jgi:hypothetical protein